jgi:hypothetical protein
LKPPGLEEPCVFTTWCLLKLYKSVLVIFASL